MPVLDDCAHLWGGDLQLSATGDLLRVNRADRTKQRVLRRFMTNSGDYLPHPEYGGDFPAQVGSLSNPQTIKANALGQMNLEVTVAKQPSPEILVTPTPSGVSVNVKFTPVGEKQPVALSFDVDR